MSGLVECVVVKRVGRFVVDVVVGSGRRIVSAYLCNTGRLSELLGVGRSGLCLPMTKGKTSFRLVAVEYGDGFAVVDTRFQEDAFYNAFNLGVLPWCRDCIVESRWPILGSSRLDFLVNRGGEELYVETKSAVQPGPGSTAMYPDALSKRGRRHIKELISFAERGVKTAIVFIAALPGIRGFKPNNNVDPWITCLLRKAVEKGVLVKAVGMMLEQDKQTVTIYNPDLPVILETNKQC